MGTFWNPVDIRCMKRNKSTTQGNQMKRIHKGLYVDAKNNYALYKCALYELQEEHRLTPVRELIQDFGGVMTWMLWTTTGVDKKTGEIFYDKPVGNFPQKKSALGYIKQTTERKS